MPSCDIYPFAERQNAATTVLKMELKEHEKKEHTYIWRNERKIWQEFDYFGAGFYLSLQPYIIASFSLTLSLSVCARICLVHVFRNKCVCFALCLLNCLRIQWASSHYLRVEEKGLNVVKFTESCFCLFIYMNIFFLFFCTLRWFFVQIDSFSYLRNKSQFVNSTGKIR